jgi:Sugar (and other) transporter
MGVNCFAVIGASFMLNFAGRKTLMFFWTTMCAVFLFVQGVAAIKAWGTIEIIMTMLFVCSFEFAPGPIVWLYMGEILNDKGISVAVFLNWLMTLIVGLLSPTIIKAIEIGPTFIMFGCFNAVAAIFIFIFMKETKGLSSEKASRLYRTDRDVIGEFESTMLTREGETDN